MTRSTKPALTLAAGLFAVGLFAMTGFRFVGPSDVAGAGVGVHSVDRDLVADPELVAEGDANVRAIARRVAERETDLPGPVRNWYGSPTLPLLWGSPHSDHATALRAVLEQARHEGLTGDELAAAEIRRDLDRLDGRLYSDSARAAAEIAVSTAFLRVAELYLQGSDRRVEMEVDWNIRPDPAPGIAVLSVVAHEGPAASIDSVRPEMPLYDRTLATLRDLRERREEGAGWSEIAKTDVAEPGDSMEIVREVRARLASGIDEREVMMARRGGDRPTHLDRDLAQAIARFQSRHGLEIDSVIGPETIAAMNVPLLAMLAAQTPLVFAGWVGVTVLGGAALLYSRVRYFAARGVDVLDVGEDL